MPTIRDFYDSANSGALFCDILRAESQFGSVVYSEIEQVWSRFTEAKAQNLTAAQFERLAPECNHPALQSFFLSQKAYFLHREGRRSNASDALFAALALDLESFSSGHCAAMDFHRLQCFLNLARISDGKEASRWNRQVIEDVRSRLLANHWRVTARTILYDVMAVQAVRWNRRLDEACPDWGSVAVDLECGGFSFLAPLAVQLDCSVRLTDRALCSSLIRKMISTDPYNGLATDLVKEFLAL